MSDIIFTVRHSDLFASTYIDMLPATIGDYPLEEMADLDGNSLHIELTAEDADDLIAWLQAVRQSLTAGHTYQPPATDAAGPCAFSNVGMDHVTRHCRLPLGRHTYTPPGSLRA
jgi:hypothetical protein